MAVIATVLPVVVATIGVQTAAMGLAGARGGEGHGQQERDLQQGKLQPVGAGATMGISGSHAFKTCKSRACPRRDRVHGWAGGG